MKKLLFVIPLIFLCVILSGWGYKGHRIINQNTANAFPSHLSFLKPNWTNILTSYASEADNRKDTDPNESPKHYIDIDNYSEFLQTGQISQSFDTVVAHHGHAFVIDQGILPWATLITFDSLKACFERRDWQKSALFAADLGHYVGDGHNPLHITKNYDGQFTGQNGVHSRYETKMISRYESQLVYPADSAHFITDVSSFVFSYLYFNYQYVDSILIADNDARVIAGNVTSDAYYLALWTKTGPFTVGLLQHASLSLADLIYTAWVSAGSPVFYPLTVSELPDPSKPRLLHNFPNPFTGQTVIAFEVREDNTPVTLMVYDDAGNLKDTLMNQTLNGGYHKITWNAKTETSGIYLCVLKSGTWSTTQKMVLTK
ncbi:MAG: T9SS type A sorting domain-containing protein [Bacteroidales bacterium]|jgi:hypothetical protein|nr:T9SS type A sorting domain-containing protein [Bacteroidales bacterium]